MQEVPVYLFLGFLESGKTKFIQETLEDARFDSGERTLLLVLEEGEEEYEHSKFANPSYAVEFLEPADMTEKKTLRTCGKIFDRARRRRIQRHEHATGLL